MRHYRVPALIPAACALVINSAALGRGIVIKSNLRRTYANLFAIIGAKSGTGKTVVFDEFMALLEELQHEMIASFKAEEKPRTEAELKLIQAEVLIPLRKSHGNTILGCEFYGSNHDYRWQQTRFARCLPKSVREILILEKK